MSDKIRFLCPACQATIKALLAAGGSKINCPRCGQRLQIPEPPKNKTVLAPMLGVEADPGAASEAPAPADPGPRLRLPRGVVKASIAAAVVASSLSCLCGIGWFAWNPVADLFASAKVTKAEARARARLPEERLVLKYILDNADDPRAVEFDRWGPHIQEGLRLPSAVNPFGNLELVTGRNEADWKLTKIIRACYRSGSGATGKKFHDELFTIQNGKVMGRESNRLGGDEWAGQSHVTSQLIVNHGLATAYRPVSIVANH